MAMHTLRRLLAPLTLLLLLAGCGADRAPGDESCDTDGDCYSQLGDPPSDASWRCVEHRCSAMAAGPFEALQDPPEEPPAEDEAEAEPVAPPVGPGNQDVRCDTAADCMELGPMPADASWVCIDHHCGLRGAGPFHAEDRIAPGQGE